ncbi:MAG: MmcB family DNA repair protein [Pseudomonadota bacterium]
MTAAADLDLNPLHPDAARIARGVTRLFGELAWTSVTELTLANRRRADICALGPHGEITIVEIKSSVADFRSDAKWPDYQPYCDRFYFAVGHDFPKDLIPDEAGLIVADGFGGAILRDPGETALKAARRKAMTLRFAHAAAGRLMRLDGRAAPD